MKEATNGLKIMIKYREELDHAHDLEVRYSMG